ncbi:hypothetical protein OSB04_020095 [Centaurea solstitialis]|uniref:Protein LURP-one-related 8 n=1 Tax=Centaurea solstitialis TaxID=347529 RepID=A0AA38W3J1_9ASTR|nr:hypothetical protein OSB04_020095 [Centaurea solstitialis]
MTKVAPETIIPIGVSSEKYGTSGTGKNPVVLTVWKKSLLFNCDGFTVYDSNGILVFRVDNYVPGGNGEIVLMDASGRSLHTIRRKRLSLSDNWLVYDGETTVNPRFSMTKHMNLRTTKSLAYVSSAGVNRNKNAIYEIEGSYAQRCCVVNDKMRQHVAEIRRKEGTGGVVLGGDVFRLVVEPSMDPSMAMAMVIVMDQMFGHSRRFRK